jgi:hypothetical protein
MSRTAKISVGKEYVEPTQTAGGGDRLPAAMANGAWNYVHYPGCWEWSDKAGAFLPTLSTISRSPGSNGVTKDGDMTFARANISTKDGRMIAPHDPRLGEHAGYLIAYPCEGGGSYHAHRGSTFTVLPNGRVLAEPVAAFDDFRAALGASGAIHPLEEWVYNIIRERESKALERMENDYASKGGDFRKEKVIARQARVARMEAAWAKLQGEAEAKPKRKVTVSAGAAVDL